MIKSKWINFSKLSHAKTLLCFLILLVTTEEIGIFQLLNCLVSHKLLEFILVLGNIKIISISNQRYV